MAFVLHPRLGGDDGGGASSSSSPAAAIGGNEDVGAGQQPAMTRGGAASVASDLDLLPAAANPEEATSPSIVVPTLDEESYRETLRNRLVPRPWKPSTSPKTFMHMHHMKTGGTSVDGLIRCAVNRMETLTGTKLSRYKLSECGRGLQRCLDKRNDPSQENCPTETSSIMSYCASLHAVRLFGWGDVDKVTVIRDPVDRVWSMYRFSLTRCYSCLPLRTVLQQIQNNTFASRGENCRVQMMDHQTTNLLSSERLYDVANNRTTMEEMGITDDEIVREAVSNLRNDFTVVGLTDRLPESVEMFGKVFPFLASNLTEAVADAGGDHDDDDGGGGELNGVDVEGCPLPHANEGRDHACGSHELDEGTVKLIEEMNARDKAVYDAAVEIWELQREILDELTTSS